MNELAVHTTTIHMLRDTVTRWPHREAVVCGDERLQYAEYLHHIVALAHELLARNARGRRVALLMQNSADLCIAMFAVHAANAQAVPLNPLYTARELGEILEDAEPHVLIYDEMAAAAVEPLAGTLRAQHAIKVGGLQSRRPFDSRSISALPEPLPRADDLATLQYTGGTTGRAKGADLTHRAVATNIAQRDALLPTQPGDRILCAMPLFHSYAVAMCLHNAANCGGAIVILPRFTADALLELLVKERITILAGSPTMFNALIKSERFSSEHFKALRLCYSGAAPLPEALLHRWEEATGAPVFEGYGQSEAGPVLSFNPLEGARKPRSVGIPLPCTEIEIVDPADETKSLPAGQVGEIRVRGPQLMRGYRSQPEETALALRDGWLYTGDLGEFDADGYLYIRERKKDMVLVSGFNVYPREVEEVLCLNPAVLEAAVIGVPDEDRGARIKAFIVMRAAIDVSAEGLDVHCRQNLAGYKVPREYVFTDKLPKTAAGKIDKKRLA